MAYIYLFFYLRASCLALLNYCIEKHDNLFLVKFPFPVYDVTRRETFTNLSDIWAKEIDLYSTNQDCIKMLVGNKVDKVLVRINSKSCKLCLHLLSFLSD